MSASLIIASFGSSKPYRNHAFDLKIEFDSASPPRPVDKPLRYGKLPEIHHIFKTDPKSPPKIITVVFAAAVIAALPSLLIVVCSHSLHRLPSANTSLFSGSPWEQTSTTPQKLLKAHLYLILHFSFRYWQWKESSLCTTRLGISSKLYQQLLW